LQSLRAPFPAQQSMLFSAANGLIAGLSGFGIMRSGKGSVQISHATDQP
jgi:hypothetical protein